MKKLLYLILFFAATTAHGQYVSYGPTGGLAYQFYQDAGRVWLASNTGVYYSFDNGISWHKTATTQQVFSCEPLRSIAAYGNELYVGMERSGIYHSIDGGDSWTSVSSGLVKLVPYTDMEIAGPNALAIRADSGALCLTTDHGVSWQHMNFAISNAVAKWITIHNNSVYVTTDMGLFKSVDNGTSYTHINPSLADIGELIWVNDTAYVSTADGIKQSIDDGVTFTSVGLAGRATSNAAVYGSSIFATVRSATNQDTVKYSLNGGASFSNASFPTSAPFTQVYDAIVAGSNILLGTDYGIYRAASSGGSFQRADSGFVSSVVRGLAANGLRMYAATSSTGLYYTPDSGETWKHNGDLAHGLESSMLTVDARNQYVHAGGQTSYYRSVDFGLTWTVGAAGLPPGIINSIFASKTGSDVLVIQAGNLYHSANDGGSFTAVSSGVPAGTAHLVTRADTSLFIAGFGGLYKGNSSFVFTPTTGITGLVTAVVHRNGSYYASTSGNGLFTSLDGSAWRAETIAPGTLPLKLNALVVNNNALVAGTDDGLYSDSTGIWTQDSLQGKIINTLAVMDGKVYAGTCGGVWSLTNLEPTPGTGVNGMLVAKGALQVYPNPSSGDFRAVLTAEKTGEAVISLRDVLGHTVLRQSMTVRAGRNELSVSAAALQLPAGVYLVQCASGNQVASQRIIIR